jgi:hypothetical protein
MLQDALTELQSQNSDMSHSLSSQRTYVKKLDTIMKLDTEAIANLSKILGDDVIQAHDKFQQLASEILWLNLTFLGQSKLHAVIRQLEFTLLQLVQQVNELLDAVQLAIQDTSSIKLVTLQSILRNVTLHLPHTYELIAGSNVQNLHLYYSLAKVSVVANGYSVSIVLSIPLKSAKPYVSLFRIMTLQTYVAPDKFVQVQTDCVYFGIQRSQRGYFLLSEAYVNRCKRSDIIVCPADTPVYDAHTLTCESSLFFQNTATHHPCRRRPLINHRIPIFYRHGMAWLFHFPTPHRVTLHCRNDTSQVSRTLLLSEAGIIHDTAECYVTSDGFQTLPELHGASRAKLDMPEFFPA